MHVMTESLPPSNVKRMILICRHCCMCYCDQEWERSYVLVKARKMSDAIAHGGVHSSGSSSSGVKRARVEASPSWLEGRVEKGEGLPVVEMRSGGGGGEEMEVVEYVVKGMKGELFIELMDMMG